MLFLQFYEHQEQGGVIHHRDSLPNKAIFSNALRLAVVRNVRDVTGLLTASQKNLW